MFIPPNMVWYGNDNDNNNNNNNVLIGFDPSPNVYQPFNTSILRLRNWLPQRCLGDLFFFAPPFDVLNQS